MYIKKILFIIAIMGIIALGGFSYYVYNQIFSPNTAFQEPEAVVLIPTDANFTTVKKQLKPYVKDMASFSRIAEKKAYHKHIKPGRFILKKGMNNNELINTLRSKNVPVKVTFNNQERLENLAGRIASQIEPDSISLLKSFTDATFLAQQKFTLANALGMYIPNQYEFYWNTSADEFRARMLQEYKRFWNDKRMAKAKKINLTPKQVMVIASIVQKETVQIDERPRVAGVYMNRYNKGMKLDADPTVIYALKKQRNDFDTVIKRVLYKDLEIDSPYNTYKYNTLPPGPIAMPDISAIDAVLNYEQHQYYYFVANPKNPGYHLFGRNLAEHNRNRQHYISWINKMGINR